MNQAVLEQAEKYGHVFFLLLKIHIVNIYKKKYIEKKNQ